MTPQSVNIFDRIKNNCTIELMEITFDKYSLIIDGKRTLIRSGAFHYFRTPGEKTARDRFLKMKAGGYNVGNTFNKYPLAVKLHISDLEATYLIENK